MHRPAPGAVRVRSTARAVCAAFVLCVSAALAWAENIDPAGSDERFAWAENAGWINAQPLGAGGPGIEVHDFELTGWLWGENIGWISASCKNTSSCGDVRYGVGNDGLGNLFGEAWGENVGWIMFRPTDASGSAVGGVTIDIASGGFGGTAWVEGIGWINFDPGPAGGTGMRTNWTCVPPPPAPPAAPLLQVTNPGPGTVLSWNMINGATGHDVIAGDVNTLRATGGDFSQATQSCLADNDTTMSSSYAATPAVGEAIWFLVRGVNCGGSGTYDSLSPLQSAGRDAAILGSAAACP